MIELSRITSSTKIELKAGAIQAITKIIQVEVIFLFITILYTVSPKLKVV